MNHKKKRGKKHVVMTIGAFGMTLVLTGCSSVPDLKPFDNEAEAQYMADALLKNDPGYADGISYDHSLLTATPTPNVQATSAPKMTPNMPQSSDTAQANGTTGAQGESASEQGKEEVPFSKLYTTKDVGISVVCYKMKKSYGSKYAFVNAENGKRLCVVLFRIKNTSGKKKRVSLAKEQIKYSLSYGENQVVKPELTIVNDDLQYFNKKLPAGKSGQAVLVFEVSKKASSGSLKLVAEGKNVMSTVSLH